MYFTNATVYQITRDLGLAEEGAVERLSEMLQSDAFTPCSASEYMKTGWFSPFHNIDGQDMVLAGSGRILLTMKREEKILPSATVKKMLADKVKQIEHTEGRKTRKKEKDELKEEIVRELLPRCLTKEIYLSGYISVANRLLVINTASASEAESFSALLRKTIGSLPIVPVQSNHRYDITMTSWLRLKQSPAGFSIGSDTKLVSTDSNGGKITFKDEDLFSDEVLAHIDVDKLVKEIRLSFGDTMSFMLTDNLQLKSIKWSEELKAQNDDIDSEDYAARMDADFALMSGEMDKMFHSLFVAVSAELISDDKGQPTPAAHDNGQDELYKEALNYVIETKKCSVSSIQRKLRIGYNRAANIVDALEADGVVSGIGHNGTREVLK